MNAPISAPIGSNKEWVERRAKAVSRGIGMGAAVMAARAENTREQYLRYALSVWRQFSTGDDICDPNRAANAMEVVCLLFDRD